MAMVVSNWQEHPSHHGNEDANGLPSLPQPTIESVATPPQRPTLSQPQGSSVSSQPQLLPSVQPIPPDHSALSHPPHTPTTPGNGSVSDGSNSIGECAAQRPQQQAGSTSGTEKPHIECVVSSLVLSAS